MKSLSLVGLALVGLALIGSRPAATAVPAQYTLTDLGANAYPEGISDSGTVVGYLNITSRGGSVPHAFVRIEGSNIDKGTLGGTSSVARAINASGQVVGYATNKAGARRAFICNGVAAPMVDLNNVKGPNGISATSLGWTLSAAYGINNNGQVVGDGTHPTLTTPGGPNTFLWQQDSVGNVTVQLVGLRNAQFETRGINDDGVVAGGVEHVTQHSAGFVFSTIQASTWQDGANTNLGFLTGGDTSNAYGINRTSQVVGFSETSSATRAFFWSSELGMINLGALGDNRDSLGSNAYNVNDGGQVVGWADRESSSVDPQYRRAYVWDVTNGMRDLNGLINPGTSWYLSLARDINNGGQIVGNGSVVVKGKAQARGFLLTPITPN